MSIPPIEFKYVTEDCLGEWKNGNADFRVPNSVPMLRFVYELCWTMVRGELLIPKLKLALDSVQFSDQESNEELSSVFADSVSQIALDLTMPAEYRARLIRLSSWVTEEEFGMGYIDLKPKPVPVPSPSMKSIGVARAGGATVTASQNETGGTQNINPGIQVIDSGSLDKDQMLRTKSIDARLDRTESITNTKSDIGHSKKVDSMANGLDTQSLAPTSAVQSGIAKPTESHKHGDESAKGSSDKNPVKVIQESAESKLRPSVRRSAPASSVAKLKQEVLKDDNKSGKSVSRAGGSTKERDSSIYLVDSKQSAGTRSSLSAVNGNTLPTSIKISNASARILIDTHASAGKMETRQAKSMELRGSAGKDIDEFEASEIQRHLTSRPSQSPLPDDSFNATKFADKQLNRGSPVEEEDRLNKRRRGESEVKHGDGARVSDERSLDLRPSHSDNENVLADDHNLNRVAEKAMGRSKDKGNERYDRDYRERSERPDRSSGEDVAEKIRDRSLERYGRERSVERMHDRGNDRSSDRVMDKAKDDKIKDDRIKPRYSDAVEKLYGDDRFHRQSLPPPPPLPPNMVPQSLNPSRRDEDADKRMGNPRHVPRLSPVHEDKEHRRSQENSSPKHRKEDEFRERRHEDCDGLLTNVEEKEVKEEIDVGALNKRRKLRRDHQSVEFSMAVPPPPPLMSQSYDGRDKEDRSGPLTQRGGYSEEPGSRMHTKESASKTTHHDIDLIYDREYDEKQQRSEQKRRHNSNK